MPRVATASKQKNKRFKGSNKSARKAHPCQKSKTKAVTKSKGIKKPSKIQRIKDQKQKKSREAERMAAANEYLDAQTKGSVTERIKMQNQMRIVLLLPCNEHADVNTLMSGFASYLQEQETLVLRTDLKACMGFPAFQVFPGPNKSPLKNRLFVIASQRQPKQLIDLAKCADIVCPVVSALSANPQKIVEDPSNFAGTFDDAGYATINLLRSLGLPKIVGLIQHLDKVQHKHHDKIQKFYKRFLSSQFGQQKCFSIENRNDISSMFRTFDSCGLVNQAWKNQRGYFLADNVEQASNGNLIASGFLKGNCINANQLVHITGFDDFQIQKIQILSIGARAKLSMQIQQNLSQFATISQDLAEFSKAETQHHDEDILSALQGLQLQAHQQQPAQQSDEQMHEEQSDNEQDWHSQNEEDADKAEERAKRVQMQMRKEDELEFEDQVQYAAEELLRQKFRGYQGLKSFKTTQWNQLQNLPCEYDRIFFFKHYNQTHQSALKDNISRGFAYPGFYVRVTLKDFAATKVSTYIEKLPIVFSFLLKHQRKMTVLHSKIQRNPYYEGDSSVVSNEMVMASIGFRRMLINPIYSRCLNGTQKTKFTKKIGEDYQGYYFCSYYGHNNFPPSPFLVFRVNPLFPDQFEGAPIFRGQLAKCDPMHVILQRIILTGYPFKINKRRSTVRFMFFNPHDVKYFRPIEVKTKMGLRGKIQESLGTHGFMKVLFNEQIKHDDTVCMHLYKRVYPTLRH